MSLRNKTFLILGSTLILLLVTMYGAFNHIFLQSSNEMERNDVKQNITRINRALESELRKLDTVAFDWANWDATYDFMETRSQDSLENLADDYFVNLQLNFMLFLDSRGMIVYATGFDLDEEARKPIPKGLSTHLGPDSPFISAEAGSVNGLLSLASDTAMVAARPILPPGEDGSPRGTLVVGRYLGSPDLATWSASTLVPIQKYSYSDFHYPEDLTPVTVDGQKGYVSVVSNSTISGFSVLPDLYGEPAVVLEFDQARPIQQMGADTFHRMTLIMLIIALPFSIFMIFFMEKTILSRVSRLSQGFEKVESRKDVFKRLEKEGVKDELSSLTGNINQMLNQLEESQQNMMITQNLLDLVVHLDPEGRFSYISPSHKAVLGHDPDELVGVSAFDFVHPSDRAKIVESFSQFAHTQTIDRQEFRYRHIKGHYLWLESIANPLYDEHDNITGILVSSRDITARKEMEEQMRRLSLYDTLTGLYNRTYFEQEMRRLQNGRSAPIGIIICDVDGLKLFNDSMGHSVGDDLLRCAAEVIKSCFREEDMVARIGGDEFAVLLPHSTPETLDTACHRIREAISRYNEESPGLHLSISIGHAIGDGGTNITELFKEADNNMYREKLHRSRSARSATVQILMKALEARDYVTEGHADRLQNLVGQLAQTLELPKHKISDIRLFAQFHDIGKVGIPDRLLFKKAPLNEEERQEMKRHCEIGHRIALSAPDLVPIADWILKHHEWWDGNGYPFGLKELEIPLECRILAIADAYDAMTSQRPYRDALSHKEAAEELRKYAGSQFDPNLVEPFLDIVEQQLEETKQKRDNDIA
ncbi:diguanylate cyclase domain-containing protein [Dethiobacter alkaliphilus]|uniref:diguanylate cyclase domain-containing protein n=1 Tax=Dethiobacter alkaliphilus TaxID=427926 RepID=UPI002227F7C1|nr:diguanylate cyclase [Dethiobacter alkaliphilus]MCW3490349.1 diguanylate cyclase [Dethiobacter alkaliphilus]